MTHLRVIAYSLLIALGVAAAWAWAPTVLVVVAAGYIGFGLGGAVERRARARRAIALANFARASQREPPKQTQSEKTAASVEKLN